MDRVTGSPGEDGRIWNLYTGPVRVSGATSLRFKAWRLGFTPSQEARLEAPLPGRAPHSYEGHLQESKELPL